MRPPAAFGTSHKPRLRVTAIESRTDNIPENSMAFNWERKMEPMVLSASEESLPPDEARKVLVWAQELADLGQGRRVDWSDSWSDDDLRDATVASLERFERYERGER